MTVFFSIFFFFMPLKIEVSEFFLTHSLNYHFFLTCKDFLNYTCNVLLSRFLPCLRFSPAILVFPDLLSRNVKTSNSHLEKDFSQQIKTIKATKYYNLLFLTLKGAGRLIWQTILEACCNWCFILALHRA